MHIVHCHTPENGIKIQVIFSLNNFGFRRDQTGQFAPIWNKFKAQDFQTISQTETFDPNSHIII